MSYWRRHLRAGHRLVGIGWSIHVARPNEDKTICNRPVEREINDPFFDLDSVHCVYCQTAGGENRE